MDGWMDGWIGDGEGGGWDGVPCVDRQERLPIPMCGRCRSCFHDTSLCNRPEYRIVCIIPQVG